MEDNNLNSNQNSSLSQAVVPSASALAQELATLRKEHQSLQNQLKVQEEYLRYLWTGMDKVRRYIFWNYVGTIIKLLIIVVPLVALYIFAAPMLKQAFQSWQSLQTNLNSVNSNIDIMGTLKELTK